MLRVLYNICLQINTFFNVVGKGPLTRQNVRPIVTVSPGRSMKYTNTCKLQLG